MIPQEKAKELVIKYRKRLPFYNDKGATNNAKQCALIAVDEILNLCWNGNLKAKEYWKEVKQEIEKL